MSRQKWQYRQIVFSLALTCFLVVKASTAQHPPTTRNSTATSVIKFNLPPRGAPGQRRNRGAASRNPCPTLADEEEPLTALVPGTNLGLTVSERPTFWFYVPYSPNNRLSVEFLLKDADKEVYNQSFPLADTPGIANIRLPETAPPLEVGKVYTWQFSVICSPNNRADDIAVYGAVERILQTSEENRQSGEGQQLDLVRLYAEQGLWLDALTTLAELYRTNSEELSVQESWTRLLRDVGLEPISLQSLVDCCITQD